MRCPALILLLFSTLAAHAADCPAYLKEALQHFDPALPPEWAYTLTLERDHEISVERFDPSLPGQRQWTLLQRDNRPATAEENSRYGSYRLTTSRSSQPAFRRGDIDLETLELLREDARHAEFRFRFRKDLEDPMLRLLELQLSVAKEPAFVERFMFQLTGPFSPVLTVKMLELRVETTLCPPTGDRPALPLRTTSRFRGRILLFKSIEEDVQSSYSDFTRVVPVAASAGSIPP